jgi:small subunit ribosomal protein S20
MPIIKSAHKALRQSIKRRILNRRRKEAFRSVVKRFKKLVTEKKIEEARALAPRLYAAIDKASKRGKALNKNTAARIKSRLMTLASKAAE